MKKVLIIILIMFITTACDSKTSSGFKNISQEKVYNISASGNIEHTYIIDVRTKQEYNAGHIKNSINIPLNEISTLKYSKDSKIIVYCRSGNRSGEAAKYLIDIGYTNVYDMGGLDNWNYDLEK